MSKIATICHNKPLLLKGIAAILKEELSVEDKLLADIEKNVVEASTKKKKSIIEKLMPQKVKAPSEKISVGEMSDDRAVLQEMFDKLSAPLRNCLIKLSLFCRDFLLPAAQQMIGRSQKESLWWLNILISKGFVETKQADSGEKMFSLHPLTQEFLKEVRQTPTYKDVLQEGKDLFCQFFRNKLKEMVHSLDTDFGRVFNDFEIERPDFEQMLVMSPEKEFLTLLPDVKEFYLLTCLLEPLLTVWERRGFFHSLAETAVKEENWPFAANLKSWEALQVNQIKGGKEARKLLTEAEKVLEKVPEDQNEQYEGAKSMFLYAQGKIYYKLSQSEREVHSYCKKALESLNQALELNEKIYGCHNATARCLNEIGNCYNRIEDLEMASVYYEKSYQMRKELSGTNDHHDMAVDLNQIAIVHEQRGAKLIEEKKEEEGKREVNKAIDYYQKALDLEVKLKIDGYGNTALFKRNMANAYMHLEEPEKAWKPALEAYEIRKRLFGVHPNTVRSLYQLGNVKYWGNDYPTALEYFYQAYEMEESLPEGNHSSVRQKIKDRISACGGTLKDGDPMKPGIFASLVSSITKKAGEAAQQVKGLVTGKHPSHDENKAEKVENSKELIVGMAEAEDDEEIELVERTIQIHVSPSGGSYPLPTYGLHVYFPPNAVVQPVDISCTVVPEAKCTSLPARGETLVSNVVRMEPENMEFREAATVSLMHCSSRQTFGYENVVKVLEPVSQTWKEQDMLAELDFPADFRKRFKSMEVAPDIRTPYVQVKLRACGTMAVFRRLVVDVIKVEPSGTNFTSKVHGQVKVIFPIGAVEKTSLFRTKVVGNSRRSSVFISLKPDKPKLEFAKPVTIQLPLPRADDKSNKEEENLKIFHCETGDEENPPWPWRDITDEVPISIHTEENVVQFEVQYFRWITCCYSWAKDTLHDAYQYLAVPQAKSVSFMAFVKKVTQIKEFPLLILMFTCSECQKQYEVQERQKEIGYELIGEQDSDQEMAVNEKAYFEVFGGIKKICDKTCFLKFKGEMEDRKTIRVEVKDAGEPNRVDFTTEGKENLCSMPIQMLTRELQATKVMPAKDPLHYCGILLEKLSDMPEGILPECLTCFNDEAKRNIHSQELWDKPGGGLDTFWKEVISLKPNEEQTFFEKLLEALRSPELVKGAGHLAKYLEEGRREIQKPIKLSQPFHIKTLSSLAKYKELQKHWKELGRSLGVNSRVIENIECECQNDTYEQCFQMFQAWIGEKGRAASLNELLSALTKLTECSDAAQTLVEMITNRVLEETAVEIVQPEDNQPSGT